MSPAQSLEKTINVAQALTAQLHVTEEAIDTALSEAAHLIEAYVASRRAIQVSTAITIDVHDHTLKAMTALNQAQHHMAAAHSSLTRVQKRVGLAPDAIIPPYDKPEDDKTKPKPAGRLLPADSLGLAAP
ncbi:hypothetical protein [Asticcacaulis sp. 201]|uniref:hypothetical protein n=1 Tax=Asticcacaulis sp. 201 TaxID=3028787 RepID=UPI0029167C18|nr:hypothetical protein [Asticcacaulis sp. 201]MDV6332825.1 hypothetical protein [Asticcacaulis sp. 201]